MSIRAIWPPSLKSCDICTFIYFVVRLIKLAHLYNYQYIFDAEQFSRFVLKRPVRALKRAVSTGRPEKMPLGETRIHVPDLIIWKVVGTGDPRTARASAAPVDVRSGPSG